MGEKDKFTVEVNNESIYPALDAATANKLYESEIKSPPEPPFLITLVRLADHKVISSYSRSIPWMKSQKSSDDIF